MNRRSFVGGIGALGLGGVFGFAVQNDDQRIANLEATVAALDDRVGRIEEIWGEPVPMTEPTAEPIRPNDPTHPPLEATESAPTQSPTEASAPSATPAVSSSIENRAWTVEGYGAEISKSFDLASGAYLVKATVMTTEDLDTFVAILHRPDGGFESLFGEQLNFPSVWNLETQISVEETGPHFVETSLTKGQWFLAFEKQPN